MFKGNNNRVLAAGRLQCVWKKKRVIHDEKWNSFPSWAGFHVSIVGRNWSRRVQMRRLFPTWQSAPLLLITKLKLETKRFT